MEPAGLTTLELQEQEESKYSQAHKDGNESKRKRWVDSEKHE